MPRTMIRSAIIFLVMVLSGCSAETSADDVDEITTADQNFDLPVPADIEYQKDEEAALAEILEEPKVRDALFDPEAGVEWHIAVVDDGTRRDGFAEYICLLLAERKLVEDKTSVRIVDYAAVNSGFNFREASLGHVRCNSSQRIIP